MRIDDESQRGVSIFDIMRGMSFALVPVRISDPAAIAEELRAVFASEREGPMAEMGDGKSLSKAKVM